MGEEEIDFSAPPVCRRVLRELVTHLVPGDFQLLFGAARDTQEQLWVWGTAPLPGYVDQPSLRVEAVFGQAFAGRHDTAAMNVCLGWLPGSNELCWPNQINSIDNVHEFHCNDSKSLNNVGVVRASLQVAQLYLVRCVTIIQ